ncbi:MAG TPA: M23 family metallopeptidase [Caulobacterales bacterium]|nr:M23 family metallopeptidase [Caulobacterales bacterium]
MRALLAALLLAACVAAEAPAQGQSASTSVQRTTIAETPRTAPEVLPIPSAPASGSTSAWPAPQLAALAAPAPPTQVDVQCAGAFAQGGVALCRTTPGATIRVDGEERGRADAQGWAVIGFDRDAPATSSLEFIGDDGDHAERTFEIAPRQFSIQRVEGLPPQTVNPTDPAIIARIARERETKNVGFASRANVEGWLDGFRWPLEGPISGSWGNQRVDNGVPKSPHYGVDIAMPIGTPVRAPASGVVALAEPDMFLEGGLVFIDHGQGLISMYLHMSEVDVHVGQVVAQGDQIGRVGNRGRATGPHLCWRMKWRDRNVDPSLAILALANARRALASAS